jgi:hypothetical protein
MFRNLRVLDVLTCITQKSGRSQWPEDLWHEMSSPSQTLRSWVRIPRKAWMYACISSMLFCIGSGLATKLIYPSKESNQLSLKFMINFEWEQTREPTQSVNGEVKNTKLYALIKLTQKVTAIDIEALQQHGYSRQRHYNR